MTYSSGLPILYFLSFLSFVVFYWIDKYLLLRYYRITPGFTSELSAKAIALLPLAVGVHCMFGIVIFSYPRILKGDQLDIQIGNNTKYYNPERLGKLHTFIFLAFSVIIFVIILLQDFCIKFSKSCLNNCYKKEEREEDSMPHCDDIYEQVSFKQLYMYLE